MSTHEIGGPDDRQRRGEPFLQISGVTAGTVLARELAQLREQGHVAVGPLWVPEAWFRDFANYRRVVTAVADHVLSQPQAGVPHYVPKAFGELEPMLSLWPHVLLLPTSAKLSRDDLLQARAFPVHPLGVVGATSWADGRPCPPAEFFCHDLDHARFKVREDLLARGTVIPDPYVDGDTFDVQRGAHRLVMSHAKPHVDDTGWRDGARRAALLDGWLDELATQPRADLAEATRWLLFELVHEKSLPLDPAALRRALETDAPLVKFRTKCAASFYADETPLPTVLAQLGSARDWLAARCESASQ